MNRVFMFFNDLACAIVFTVAHLTPKACYNFQFSHELEDIKYPANISELAVCCRHILRVQLLKRLA